MKKALLTLAVAVMAVAMGAQAQENNTFKWVVGGTGSFSHDYANIDGNANSESTLIHIEPFVGYQLSDRWRVGLTFGYDFGNVKKTVGGATVSVGNLSTYNVGPYVHFDIVKYKRWILWAEAEAFYIWSPKTVPMDGDPLTGELVPVLPATGSPMTLKVQGFQFTVKPGITYVLDKHVNIDLNLNLLGWYYANSRMEVIDGGATGVAAGKEMTSGHNGLVLDLLKSSPSDYWEKVAIGITLKF